MLQWNGLHPYNAVHGARLRLELDPEKLRRVVVAILEARGLTGFTLSADHRRFNYAGGPADCDLRVSAGGDDLPSAVAKEIERQVNTGFAPVGRCAPLRFFVLSGSGSFFLGLAYLHAVADAESIVRLLNEIVDRYQDPGAPAAPLAPSFRPVGGTNPLWHRPVALLRQLAALPSSLRAMRRCARPAYDDFADMSNGFSLLQLTGAQLQALIKAARKIEVTLNDLFLALLMHAVSPPAATRVHRRREIAVGSIVNLRKDLRAANRPAFGLFLGSFVVSHAMPDGIGVLDLARDLHAQTTVIKQRRLYLGTPIKLWIAGCVLSLFSTKRRMTFYQKHHPLWGGVTNMNLNTLWRQPAGGAPVDYFRAVSTGPATPLVLSVTTAGDRVNVGISFRLTVFSRAEVEGIKNALMEGVAQLAGCG